MKPNLKLSGKNRQVLSTICVNLLTFSLGNCIGWATSGIDFLTSRHADLETGSLSPSEADLINSMYCVGGLISSVVFGSYLCDKIGRKWSMRVIIVPFIINYLLVATSKNSMMILFSRVFAGLCAGGLYIAVPLFVSEIAEDKIRGTLGAMFIIGSSSGILFAYIVGSHMHYNKSVLVYMIFPFLNLIGSFFLLETPYYLMKNGKTKEAEESLMFYRGKTEMEGDVANEFESLKKYVEFYATQERVSLSDFLTKAARKSIIIGAVMVALEQFSGCFALMFYATSIFKNSGVDTISPETATIIVGVIQLIGSCCSKFLIDRAGRKFLIAFGSFGIAIGMTIFGAATQLIEAGESSAFIKIMPVVALALCLLMVNVGVFPLTFVVLSEIVPSNVKSYIFTLCMILSWTFSFTVFNLLNLLVHAFGAGGHMYFFAINSVLGALFAIFYIPETKGKSLEEIAHIMGS